MGFSAAKAIAWALGKPFVGVNHILAHLYANFLTHPPPRTPLLCLTASGGHSDLLYVPEPGSFQLIGETRDDAAGECLDKAARVLGLGYPGGPAMEKLALEGAPRFPLPKPVMDEDYNFSFSGLKTAVVNLCHRMRARGEELPRADLAASLQEAVVSGLVGQLRKAAKAYRVKTVLLSGGVAANETLRARAGEAAREIGAQLHVPPPGCAPITPPWWPAPDSIVIWRAVPIPLIWGWTPTSASKHSNESAPASCGFVVGIVIAKYVQTRWTLHIQCSPWKSVLWECRILPVWRHF